MLLRHDASATWAYWDIEDGLGTRRELDLSLPAAGRVVGAGDLHCDSRDDILIRADGTHAWYWANTDAAPAVTPELPSLTRNPWFTFHAMGDFDGDGRDDVLLRNSTNGVFIYYEMRLEAEGVSTVLHRRLGLTQNRLFEVVAAADLNGDGRDDTLMRHAHEGRWNHYERSRERGVFDAGDPVRADPAAALRRPCHLHHLDCTASPAARPGPSPRRCAHDYPSVRGRGHSAGNVTTSVLDHGVSTSFPGAVVDEFRSASRCRVVGAADKRKQTGREQAAERRQTPDPCTARTTSRYAKRSGLWQIAGQCVTRWAAPQDTRREDDE